MESVNFLKFHPGGNDFDGRRKQMFLFCLKSVFLLLLAGLFFKGFCLVDRSHERRELIKKLASVQLVIGGKVKAVREFHRERRLLLAVDRKFHAEHSLQVALGAVEQLKNRVVLFSSTSYEGRELNIKGEAADEDQVSGVVKKIIATAFFRPVRLVSLVDQKRGGVRFEINAVYKQ